MLYVLYGSDRAKANDAIEARVRAMREREPEAPVLSFSGEELEPGALSELIHGQGLFAPRSLIVLRRVLEVDELRDAVLSLLAAMKESSNLFVLYEERPDAKTRAKLERAAEKVEQFELPAKKEVSPFNRFSLADALAARDRRKLWVLYEHARLEGVAPEELHGILFWQARALLLARRHDSAEAAGLKPFPYKKARQAAQRFKEDELERLATRLLSLYHDARRGLYDLDSGLEYFILRGA